jgi:hypothetical protein
LHLRQQWRSALGLRPPDIIECYINLALKPALRVPFGTAVAQ